VLALIARLLRLAAFVICAIVIASFAIFAINQTRGASAHQQAVIAGGAPAQSASEGSHSNASATKNEGSPHKEIDEASNRLTSPFSGLTSGSSSEWATRGVKLLLALLLYGFGLGFLARILRVRA
jgi:hypothetical protein